MKAISGLLASSCAVTGLFGLAACTSGPRRSSTPPSSAAAPLTVPTTAAVPTTPRTSTTLAGNGATDWTTYHADNSRSGVAATQPSFTPIRVAWRAELDDDAIYGQALVADGRVLVATEDDDIFALDPASGRVLWRVNIGEPLRRVASPAEAGCGDIDPLGITSTPVVDTSTDTVYAVGEVSDSGGQPVHHELVGVDISTGAVRLSVDADPPVPAGENVIHLLQRAALLLANGNVYVAYGGQYGDCGAYHGWVVAVPVRGGPSASFDVTPLSSGGAIWQGGGGPSADAAGSIYVSTGNPNSSGPDPWAEAVLKLAPNLAGPPEAVFQDTHATGDLDLATGDVVVLADGDVFAVGKTDIPYLLTQAALGTVGGLSGRVCGSDPDGGAAYDAADNSLYVPCQDGGIDRVDLTHGRVGLLGVGANSAPILVDGELWALSYPSGVLEQIDPVLGSILQSTSIGQQVPHFASPSAADGLLLVGTTHGLVALTGPAGPTIG